MCLPGKLLSTQQQDLAFPSSGHFSPLVDLGKGISVLHPLPSWASPASQAWLALPVLLALNSCPHQGASPHLGLCFQKAVASRGRLLSPLTHTALNVEHDGFSLLPPNVCNRLAKNVGASEQSFNMAQRRKSFKMEY